MKGAFLLIMRGLWLVIVLILSLVVCIVAFPSLSDSQLQVSRLLLHFQESEKGLIVVDLDLEVGKRHGIHRYILRRAVLRLNRELKTSPRHVVPLLHLL